MHFPKHTFDSLEVGPHNSEAVAAARAFATYAPEDSIFEIRGDGGQGKTHLLHSIGAELAKNELGARVECVNAEYFINAKRCGPTHCVTQFEERVAAADAVLIDDLHEVAGDPTALREVLQLLPRSGARKRAAVTMSSRSQLTDFVAHEVRRLSGVRSVSLGTPDMASCTAILKARAADIGVTLPAHVLAFLVRVGMSEVRRLVCSLSRLHHETRRYGLRIEDLDDAMLTGLTVSWAR